jgi:hypothetical protein
MKAVLWDGTKQLNGELEIGDHQLQFIFYDFGKTNISLEIPFDMIDDIQCTKVYGIRPNAMSIHSKLGKTNVFVMDDAKEFKEKIEYTLKKESYKDPL